MEIRVTNTADWTEVSTEKERKYLTLIYGIVDYLKREKDHEGTTAVSSPSDILDKIYGMSQELQEVKERILL